MSDGRVRVDAPGLTSTPDVTERVGMMTSLMRDDTGADPSGRARRRPRGTFTLTTDAQVLTNNTVDGPVAAGRSRRLVWTVGGLQQVIPEALLRL